MSGVLAGQQLHKRNIEGNAEGREGANREKLTVKKIINNDFFFSPFMSVINWVGLKICKQHSSLGIEAYGSIR